MTDINRLEEEKKYLDRVKIAIREELEYQRQELKDTPGRYKNRYSDAAGGDEKLIETLLTIISTKMRKLETLDRNPYFGRIDFLEDGQQKEIKLYIGKTGVNDRKTGESLIIDWRAPICTLYYDQSIGPVSYASPSGTINGDLKLKSQILIKDGELISVRDTDLVTNDELLLPYLESSAEDRLKDIVASIQTEQNSIIRLPLLNNLIIQGVAGSGKTTVALHRIAYLIYNEEDLSASNFAIIGPNKYFLNYISGLLPDLDTENIEQYTFEELAEILLGDNVQIVKNDPGMSKLPVDVLKIKSSLEYKDAIASHFNQYIEKVLSNGIIFQGLELFSAKQIKQYFMTYDNIASKISYVQKALVKDVKDRHEELYDIISQKHRQCLSALAETDPEREEIFAEQAKLKKDLKGGCANAIKGHFKPLKITPLNLYNDFIVNLDRYMNLSEKDMLYFQKETLQSLKTKKVPFEDLPALMYLGMLINGYDDNKFNNFAHITIDEAQDYGLFNYYIMKKLFKNSTFSVFGDLAQSIYPTYNVGNWEALNETMFENESEILHLNKSYRTTIQITNIANSVLKHLDLQPANPVIRSGEEVVVSKTESVEYKDMILALVNNFIQKGYKSIALICKDESEMQYIKGILDEMSINSAFIDNEYAEYNGGLCILTSALSKGLEFDAVVITSASENCYPSDDPNKMKLLYVAMTRALHEVHVLFNDELTKPLDKYTKDKGYQFKLEKKQGK